MPTDRFNESNLKRVRHRMRLGKSRPDAPAPVIKRTRHGDSVDTRPLTLNERSSNTRRLKGVAITLPALPPFKEPL